MSLLLLFGFVRKTSDGEFQRGRLFGYIESNPGIHLSALTRLSGLGNNQVTYHLDRLEKEERIWSIREGRLLIFFADSVPVGNPISSPILEINFSKNSIKRAILMELNKVDLMDLKGPNGGQLAKEIGISPQVISYHLRSLIRWEMVNRKRIGLKVSLSITKLGIEALISADLEIEN
jgi:predicted transcriptional regulator